MPGRILSIALLALVLLPGCASTPEVYQPTPDIALQTQEQDGVVVSAQGVILRGGRLDHPAPHFWITVRNYRSEPISILPTDMRAVDGFGEQFTSVRIAMEGLPVRGQTVSQPVMDPRGNIRTEMVRLPSRRGPAPGAMRDRPEIIYPDARVTFVVSFPYVEEPARSLRVIVPIPDGGEGLRFEFVFSELVRVE